MIASHDQGDHGLVDVKRKSSTNSSGKSSEGGHLVRSSSGNSWIVNYCDDSKTWKVKYSPTKAEETIMKHTHKPSPEEETVMKHTHKPSPEEETIMKHTHKAERRESTSSYDMKTVGVAQVCDEFGQSSDAAVHVGGMHLQFHIITLSLMSCHFMQYQFLSINGSMRRHFPLLLFLIY